MHLKIYLSYLKAFKLLLFVVISWATKIYFLELLLVLEGTLNYWSRLHLQLLAPTYPHWARVVGYDPVLLVDNP
jgi:hypothetical protein